MARNIDQIAGLVGLNEAETKILGFAALIHNERMLDEGGTMIVVIATVLFAYSTLIGWNYYGEKAIEYLAGGRAIRIYRIFFVAAVVVGAMMQLDFVWNFSDLMNGLMAIPNLIAPLLLSKVVSEEARLYFAGEAPTLA